MMICARWVETLILCSLSCNKRRRMKLEPQIYICKSRGGAIRLLLGAKSAD